MQCYIDHRVAVLPIKSSNPPKYLIGLEPSDKGSKLLEAIQFVARLMVISSFLVDLIIVGNHVMM